MVGICQMMDVAQDQERQLAALLTMQDLAGASLLSSAEARGSSNLVYILRTLQVHADTGPPESRELLQRISHMVQAPEVAVFRICMHVTRLPADFHNTL